MFLTLNIKNSKQTIAQSFYFPLTIFYLKKYLKIKSVEKEEVPAGINLFSVTQRDGFQFQKNEFSFPLFFKIN